MFSKVKRPYKDSSAADTIGKIKSILENLDLVPRVMFSHNPYPEVYSTRVQLDESHGAFGTNGKGEPKSTALPVVMPNSWRGYKTAFMQISPRQLSAT